MAVADPDTGTAIAAGTSTCGLITTQRQQSRSSSAESSTWAKTSASQPTSTTSGQAASPIHSLNASMSAYLVDRIDASPNIEVLARTEVTGLHGDEHVTEITLTDRDTTQERSHDCRGLFLFIGAVPYTDWVSELVQLDDKGFILTDTAATNVSGYQPLAFETSRPGVFAAGDARAGSMKRVAVAAGEGSSAIRSIHEHLAR